MDNLVIGLIMVCIAGVIIFSTLAPKKNEPVQQPIIGSGGEPEGSEEPKEEIAEEDVVVKKKRTRRKQEEIVK